MCRLTSGSGTLQFGMADHLTSPDNQVHLASEMLQLHEASIEVVEVSNDCLPCIEALGESDLCEDLLQN